MTPERMAQIHATSFTKPRPWTATEFRDLLTSPSKHAIIHQHGFAIVSIAGGEAELLTLAIDPDHRRKGIARLLCNEFETLCVKYNASDIYLEVSTENPNATALYLSLGFKQTGMRKDYYLGTKGTAVSANVMKKEIVV